MTMSDHHLLISNPPQPAGDLTGVTELFELSAAEIRMKANFQAPEIWFASEDFEHLTTTAESLEKAGLNVVLVRHGGLQAVPDRAVVQAFTFHEDGLELLADTTNVRIPYDEPVIMVRCKPRRAASAEDLQRGANSFGSRLTQSGMMGSETRRRSSLVDMLAQHEVGSGYAPFLEFYVSNGASPRRFAVIENVVDFSGLHGERPRKATNMVMFVADCNDRFTNSEIDERLMGLRIRTPLRPDSNAARTAQTGRRRGFSFATPKLAHLLEQSVPDLGHLEQPDLSSRLVYVTCKAGLS